MIKYTLESDVDDYVKSALNSLGLQKIRDYNEKSSMSDYLKDSLKGASKTDKKTSFGQPDFSIEKYNVPVVIENKLHNSRHIASSKQGLKMDEGSVRNYAVNGAVYYAQCMIASRKYDEVIAIGISGDSDEDVKMSVYYVFSSNLEPKYLPNYSNLNFLQNKASFADFYRELTITDAERHSILIKSRDEILRQAKRLNKLMNNFNIGTDQRVVYVSGMLLAMQDVLDNDGNIIDKGLTMDDLKGILTAQKRDSILIIDHIQEFLDRKDIASDKKTIMVEQFKNSISLDPSRDEKVELDPLVGDILSEQSSITKQVFSFLYKYVFLAIDMTHGALDIMAEMYSTFLKYALSDGASLGKVLTPPYITNLMARILDINKDSRVMDLATGSAAFLVAAMDLMILDANRVYGKNTTIARDKIESIKKHSLLGIEVDAKMYTLAAANMILRGDGSSNIQKANSFTTPEKLYRDFNANKLLLNPPFSHEDFGLPFFEFGLDHMEKGGVGAIIIQDSAGSGKAISTTKRILSKHTMLASIKMPADLFVPNAIVQTSIYVFRAKTPHNFDYDVVKFIDFRNDGYKRTERGIKDIDSPIERYHDLFLLYKLGKNAVNNSSFHNDLWNVDDVYCEGTISPDGDDWNFEKHITHKTDPIEGDFDLGIKNYLSWNIAKRIEGVEVSPYAITEPYKFDRVPAKKVFRIKSATPSYDKGELRKYCGSDDKYEYITRTAENRGICDLTGFIDKKGLQPAGTFSLGLMQMKFFYRRTPWYAGQFVKIVSCLSDKVDDFAMVYLETVLNGLSSKLLSVLVRDVEDTFLETALLLPVTKEGEVDYQWMSEFIKAKRDTLEKELLASLPNL